METASGDSAGGPTAPMTVSSRGRCHYHYITDGAKYKPAVGLKFRTM